MTFYAITDCSLRRPHEPHGACRGMAPEFPSERVLTADEANKIEAQKKRQRDLIAHWRRQYEED